MSLNMRDSSAVLRIDVGFYVGILVWSYYSSYEGSMSFGCTRSGDSSSCRGCYEAGLPT